MVVTAGSGAAVAEVVAGAVVVASGVVAGGEVVVGVGATVVVTGGTVVPHWSCWGPQLSMPQIGTPGGHPSVVMPHSVGPQLSVPQSGPGTQLWPGGMVGSVPPGAAVGAFVAGPGGESWLGPEVPPSPGFAEGGVELVAAVVAVTEVFDAVVVAGRSEPDPFDEHADNASTNATRASSNRTIVRDRLPIRVFGKSAPAIVGKTRAR
ncbi:hypothetical protein ATM97_20735 [Nocardia sp. MH4]|uniref:hypothetical protein n=1 Tax=unclassified Nocardia TaxID=2637762 RepID=UPI001C4EA6A2|nr:hypothetical protein [Nocardia sp. MH4]MBW0272607.1 hypothetical protein [Nocardia sp. MH4]